MKMRLLCIAVVLLLAALACVGGGGGSGTNKLTGCATVGQFVDCEGVTAGVH